MSLIKLVFHLFKLEVCPASAPDNYLPVIDVLNWMLSYSDCLLHIICSGFLNGSGLTGLPVPCVPPQPWPAYVADRRQLYDQLKMESDALLAKRAMESQPITVQLPDGKTMEAQSWVTSPYQLACKIRYQACMEESVEAHKQPVRHFHIAVCDSVE